MAVTSGEVVVYLILVLVAATAGYFAVTDWRLAAALLLMPAGVWLISNRRATALALAAALPYVNDISGGSTGFNIALSDVLMTVLVGALAAEWMMTHQAPELSALKALRIPLLPYVALMGVLLVFHLSTVSTIKTGQRLDLFLFPLIIGAAIVRWGDERRFLTVYVVCAGLFGLVWHFVNNYYYLGQKNPVGQFVANAIIILIAVKPLRRKLWPLAPVLIGTLFLTQSRGAIVSVGVAVIVILALQSGVNRIRSFVAMVPLAAVTVASFMLLPDDVQARNTSFTVGTGTAAEYSLHIREQYAEDAWALIHAHPYTGIGVGRYLAGSIPAGDITTDPHQLLLLQAAEGGYLLAGLFLLLVLGTVAVIWRRARHTELGPLAAALTLALVSHGLVDVYWVRGTPVLGWLVTGMALAQSVGGRTDVAAPASREPEPVPA